MIKVITPIGAVVEVDDGVYEANSHILKKFEEGDEVESAIITSKEEAEEATTETLEVESADVTDESTTEADAVEVQEEVSEVTPEPTPEVTPENGNEEIISQAKTKAIKPPKTK